eukprot:CAMPEP_0179272986 /NCGR_PEP_ID=MMETSP0797-20121207/32780_1 /TAXON_ID=47934 /ORGANISM="Dinophysis acuminata, Strain DAEP01" /LENGTH=62 /DNA_ID=CAMNT_0020981399 /DNA_START=121 /DNA_END=305 /DNA_ORIENTATION=+
MPGPVFAAGEGGRVGTRDVENCATPRFGMWEDLSRSATNSMTDGGTGWGRASAETPPAETLA